MTTVTPSDLKPHNSDGSATEMPAPDRAKIISDALEFFIGADVNNDNEAIVVLRHPGMETIAIPLDIWVSLAAAIEREIIPPFGGVN